MKAQAFRVIAHGSCDSTSERAFAELAAGRAQHGDVHTAETQTAGRGRLGRKWISPVGEGLYMSLIWSPSAPAPSIPELVAAAALSVCDAVHALLEATPQTQSTNSNPLIKWPNDIEVHGAKLAGILVEARSPLAERPCYVIGIGLNLRQRSFPQELTDERPVTSLALMGLDVAPSEACTQLLGSFQERWQQQSQTPEQLLADFVKQTGLANQQVEVHLRDPAQGRSPETQSRVEVGQWLGIDPQQGLVLNQHGNLPTYLAVEHISAIKSPV